MRNCERYDSSEYAIEQLHEYDDVDLVKTWHRYFIWLHPIVSCSVFLTYGAYFGYRVWCNWSYRQVQGGLNSASWIFIAAEGICIGMPLLFPFLPLLFELVD
jgi:hypothetical protein